MKRRGPLPPCMHLPKPVHRYTQPITASAAHTSTSIRVSAFDWFRNIQVATPRAPFNFNIRKSHTLGAGFQAQFCGAPNTLMPLLLPLPPPSPLLYALLLLPLLLHAATTTTYLAGRRGWCHSRNHSLAVGRGAAKDSRGGASRCLQHMVGSSRREG